ncbi:hypothetical protein [Bradyrhizobium sp. USDA 3397]
MELIDKSAAYDSAIATSSNEAILLNAVRASQRAPMSFVSFGQVLATPTFSGTIATSANFDPAGFTSQSVNPGLSIGGGFNSFTMDNLNTTEFAQRMRIQIPIELAYYFEAQKWPEELIDLLLIGSLTVSPSLQNTILAKAEQLCFSPATEREAQICERIASQQAELVSLHCFHYGRRPVLFNSGRDACSMYPFQLFLRQTRLLGINVLRDSRIRVTLRTPMGLLYYLGELIAAQNYSEHRFDPTVLVGTSIGYRAVPLFQVRRNLPAPAGAAVTVSYGGDAFHIPRPAFGSVEEARSLQVLDLVSQVIVLRTKATDIPKINTVGLIAPVR